MAARLMLSTGRLSAGLSTRSRRAVAPRASNESDNMIRSTDSSSTIFYGGSAYTEAEFNKAVESGAIARPEPVASASTSASTLAPPSLVDVMAFSGAAPEIVNGRLAMLGFVSAVAAEFSSGQGVLRQWSEEPTGIFLAFVLFAAGSLVPLLSGSPASVQAQKIGPFNRDAEMLNGRAAMIGFASLLVIEAVKGTPLF